MYQYFPNKHALFVALHERQIGLVADVMRRRGSQCAESSPERLVEFLVDGMVEAHTVDPALSELLLSEVPHRADGMIEFSIRFHEAFRAALTRHTRRFGRNIDLDTRAFVMTNMVEALGHAVVLRRPRGLSLAKAEAEILQGHSCVPCILRCQFWFSFSLARSLKSPLTRFREQSTGKRHLSNDATDRRAESSIVADIPNGKCGEAQKIFIS